MDKVTVAEARRLRNISQTDAAKHIGVSLNTYRSKESGETKFYYDEAVKFSELVNLKLDSILFAPDVAKN